MTPDFMTTLLTQTAFSQNVNYADRVGLMSLPLVSQSINFGFQNPLGSSAPNGFSISAQDDCTNVFLGYYMMMNKFNQYREQTQSSSSRISMASLGSSSTSGSSTERTASVGVSNPNSPSISDTEKAIIKERTAIHKIDVNKDITTFGDSTANGLGQCFEKNLGVCSAGFLAQKKLASLDSIKQGDQIIISLGYNEPEAANNPKAYTEKVVKLVEKMQNKGAKVAIIGIKAQRNESYDRKIAILNNSLKDAASQTNVQFVDISGFGLEQPDGVHFKDNKEFATKIREALAS